MQVAAISIGNYRSFGKKEQLDGLSPVNIVIGPNNTGKSNVLKLLQMYQGMYAGNQSFNSKMLHADNKTTPMTFEIEYQFLKAESDHLLKFFKFQSSDIAAAFENGKILRGYKHSMSFGADGLLTSESIATLDSRGGTELWVPLFGQEGTHKQTSFWFVDLITEINKLQTSGQSVDAQKKQITSKGQPNRAFDWNISRGPVEFEIGEIIKAFVKTWTFLLPTRAVSPRGSPGEDTLIQPNASNLVRVLNSLQTEDPDYFVEVIKKVQQIMPGLTKITAPLRGGEVTTILKEPGGVSVELADSSSGVQQTLSIVTYIFTSQVGSLLMIEEPEMNLHASAQRALFQIIKLAAIQRPLQFIITSHSTIFAQISEPNSVYYLDKVEGSSRVRRLKEGPELKELKQALGHENSDIFGYNAILILEGPTETAALPKLTKPIEMNLLELGIKIMNIGGAGEIRRISHLLEFVSDTGTIPFVMLDGHSVIKNEIPRLIKEDLLKKENVLILDQDFEDCFNKKVLAQALVNVASHHGLPISVDESEITRSGGDKNTSAVLHRLYHEKTGFGLSKPELGDFVADIILGIPLDERTLTAPEEFLKMIKTKLTK